MRFVKLVKRAFLRLVKAYLIRRTPIPDNAALTLVYFSIFAFRKIRFKNLETLTQGKKFDNIVRSNGYEFEFLCRKVKEHDKDKGLPPSPSKIANLIDIHDNNTAVWEP
ncbi:MAG: hypothetical protein EXX96DRAFT_534683 [Benjaminiella poitrasii]|nr:MAG: hypothetical protein EXX96DRAFT_534683 [Benjaminiella poitrasii]